MTVCPPSALPSHLGCIRQISHRSANTLEDIQCFLKIGARVRGGDDRANAAFVARDGREGDALGKNAGGEQPIRELHGPRALADDHRRDRRL